MTFQNSGIRAITQPRGRHLARGLSFLVSVSLVLAPVSPALRAAELPVPATNWVSSGQVTQVHSGNSLTIDQSSHRAILNWQSFNIGADGVVRFNQPGASAAVLNRIFDANPSVIQGQLSANGQVYLINQNGIVFGQGAQVNVGSLIASTLNINNELFEQGLLSADGSAPAFTFEGDADQFMSSLVRIESGASLQSATGGRILVFAPRVENAGNIATPEGQAILAAGSKIYLAAPQDPTLRGLLVEVDSLPAAAPAGTAARNTVINESPGAIVAERGNITLAALAVNQSGRLAATTSVNLNGSIHLLARDTVIPVDDPQAQVIVPVATRGGSLTLGENSVTEVLAEAQDARTILDEQSFTPSRIELTGNTVHLRRDSRVRAPGGEVSIVAQSGQEFQLPGSDAVPGTRVYLEAGASVDVAGTRDVAVPIERNVIEVELRGTELADSPLQRDSFLRGQVVRVDIREGTPLANISGVAAQIGRTVLERTSVGGSVIMRSEGDIVLREGAAVDVSGGSIRYLDGYIDTTKLYSQGKVYDIGEADPGRIYDGWADTVVKRYDKWGVSETFSGPHSGVFEQGYVEGRNAGTAQLSAHAIVLDGIIEGGTVAGPYQRERAAAGGLPLYGQLILGELSQAGAATPDFRLGSVLLQSAGNPLAADFGFDDGALPEPFAQQTILSLDRLRQGQIGRLAVYSNGRIELADALALPAGGSLNLTGRELDIRRDISVPAGQITLATRDVIDPDIDPAHHVLNVAAGVTVSSRGMWINDSPLLNTAPVGPALYSGGTIALSSAADLVVGSGSVIDVSGGGWLQADGRLVGGDAGSIALKSGRVGVSAGDAQQSSMLLGASLLGFAAGRGGSLSIDTTRIGIGAAVPAAAGLLSLEPAFFDRGGFLQYTLTGQNGVTVGAGAQISATARNLLFDDAYALQASGADIFSFSRSATLPLYERQAATLTLNAASSGFGNLLVEEGASLAVDPGGSITLQAGRQLTMLGSATARGGSIALATAAPSDNDSFDPDVSLWLGAGARLLASGDTVLRPVDDTGRRDGVVLDGGSISLRAGKGYVVAQAGAVLDVSGAHAMLDLPRNDGGVRQFQPTDIASHAGSIDIRAREGILFAGEMRARAGGPSAAGGSLSVAMEVSDSNPFFPFGERLLTLYDGAAVLPAQMQPGSAIDFATYNGKGYIDASAVRDGGFDSLALRARDRIEFDGAFGLALRSRITLDAPVISATPGSTIALDAAYLALGNTDIFRQDPTASSGGDATLALSAGFIELVGQTSMRGFGSTLLDASGDLRLRGVLSGTSGRELAGGLVSGGNIHVRAAQIYPATLSRFTLAVRDNPAGRISFERVGIDTPVLSAAGRLTVEAPFIEQGGVLKAPFGEIALNASQQLVLAPGSETSVSAEDQLIPFGRTELSGRDYTYGLDSSRTLIFGSPPEKRIALSAPDIDVAVGATVDLSGGGDLYAYEFVAGPGGSRDVLDPLNAAGTYAILPSLGSGFAPYDRQYYSGVTDLEFGDAVYLAGANGLAAGYYTLLPARYALLPGAYLVTAKSGFTDLLPDETRPGIDGSHTIAGYRVSFARDGSVIRDSRSAGFQVVAGSAARTRSEYTDTLASAFFADSGVRLPADAGRLAISASGALSLEGDFRTAHAAAARGAEVDIDALRLAVLGATADDPGTAYVHLDAASLGRLNAESLLLGGLRTSVADGFDIQVGAQEVLIDNDGGAPLRGPELLIAARDRVTVKAGSVIEGTGTLSGDPQRIRIGDSAQPGDGDGALLRVAAGPQATLLREGVSRTRGTLLVEEGATVRADQSINLDATFDNRFAGALLLGENGSLALGASRIGIGDVPAGVEGLTFSGGEIAALGSLGDLRLRSYSTVDIYGSASLGSTQQLRNLAIEAAGIGGYGVPDTLAVLSARTVSLSNPNGLAFSSVAGLTPNAGGLQIVADQVLLGATQADNGFTAEGFSFVEAIAAGEILLSGQGTLATSGDLTLSAARIAAETGARYSIAAGGELRTLAGGATAQLPPAEGLAASLTLAGSRLTHGGRIVLPAGAVTLAATGGSNTDNVLLQSGSEIVVAGFERQFSDTLAAASAGSVTLVSAAGDVMAQSGSRIDLQGTSQSDAGTLKIVAEHGAAQLSGTILASAPAAAAADVRQGAFFADVGALADFSALNSALNQAGFLESRDIRVRSGNILVAGEDSLSQRPADRVTARSVRLAADDGDIHVGGIIDVSGAKGGSIVLAAGRISAGAQSAGNVILSSGAVLDASSSADPATVTDANGLPFGTRGQGGSVLLSSSGTGAPGDVGIAVRSGALIDVASVGPAANGSVVVRAPRTGADVLIEPLSGSIVANTAAAAPLIVAEAVQVYEDIGVIGAAPGVGQLTFAQLAADNSAFMDNAANINARLGGGARVRPGSEVRSSGQLTLTSDWNLFSSVRPGGEPGVLTLRAGGDLLLNGSLSDGFASAATTATLQAGGSWSYRLVGGADISAADPLAVQRAVAEQSSLAGDVTVGAGKLVRTGTGSIDIAAGRDIILSNQNSVIYTAGERGPTLANFGNIAISGAQAEFPMGGGDVSLFAGRDIAAVGGTTQLINNWLYRQGKTDEALIQTQFRNPAWWPRFRDFQQGVGALGGGDVDIAAGGDIHSLSAVVPTNGRLPQRFGEAADPALLHIQGGGDLDLVAGGDISSAVLYVDRGAARVRAGGSLGSSRSVIANGVETEVHSVLALGDARIGIEAGGDVTIDAIFNPTILPQAALNRSDFNRIAYYSTYSARSAVDFLAQAGDVRLANNIAGVSSAFASLLNAGSPELDSLVMYPGTLRAAALGGDIRVDNGFQMFPAAAGNLELLAEGSVSISQNGDLVAMSDIRPDALPSPVNPSSVFVDTFGALLGNPTASGFLAHSDPLLHADDPEPIRIVARTGDVIGSLSLAEGASVFGSYPKRALIEAGRDVRNVWIFGQNLHADDVTSIRAGRDVVFDTLRDLSGNQSRNSARIELGGPGRLEVAAGRNIDLGNSSGLVTRGNLNNPYLSESGAAVTVRAGVLDPDYSGIINDYILAPAAGQESYATQLTEYMRAKTGEAGLSAEQALARYAALPRAQQIEFADRVFYAELRAAGRFAARTEGGLERYARGFDAIAKLYPAERNGLPVVYDGDVSLFFSQIKTEQGGDIDIMAPGGLVNAGLANPGSLSKPASQLGIVTARGGSIRSFVEDDFLVNQSRVFTLQGGDILLWASEGNIDAGKGAKTARATPPPQLIIRGEEFILDTTNSVAGSGIAVLLAKEGVIPGDVDLIAPRGEVNAGDAGIRAAGNINIAAVRVVGADNIQVGGVATGVPVDSGGLGASLAGVSSVASGASTAAAAGLGGADSAAAQRAPLAEAALSWLDVFVLGFGEENCKPDDIECMKRQHKQQ